MWLSLENVLDNAYIASYNGGIAIQHPTEEVSDMTETEARLRDVFEKVFPALSELDKEKLLAFGEGMAFKAGVQASAAEQHETAAEKK